MVEPKIAIARILADLNLALQYGIAIRIYASRKFLWISFGGCNIDRQIFRLSSTFNVATINMYTRVHVP